MRNDEWRKSRPVYPATRFSVIIHHSSFTIHHLAAQDEIVDSRMASRVRRDPCAGGLRLSPPRPGHPALQYALRRGAAAVALRPSIEAGRAIGKLDQGHRAPGRCRGYPADTAGAPGEGDPLAG